MKLAAVLLALAAAAAQTTSSSGGSTSAHSGWSMADTMQTATDVVVADILSGGGVDDGSQVTVRATVRVVRVLAGAVAPGAEIPLTWQYKPTLAQSPASTTKVEAERGLWFLRKSTDGRFAPLQAGFGLTGGGYYLPAGAAPRYYAADAPLAHKVACEIAPLIEDIAAQHSADLLVRTPMPIPPPGSPEVRTRTRFYTLYKAFQQLETKATRDIYVDFSARPEPYLKAIGIGGRLQGGDASALFDVERNLPALAPVFQTGAIPLFAPALDLRNNLPAALAFARIAVGETAFPVIESNAAMQLAWTRSPELLPYFVTMLGSPNPSTRGAVLMGFCPLLRESALWKPEMAQHCPNRSGSNPEPTEQADIAYWRAWWEANREQIAKTTPLADVRPPARYSIPQNIVPVDVPIEIRFLSLLHMSSAMSDHYHAGDGAMVAGEPPGRHDPVAGQLGEADRGIYTAVTAGVNAKLDAHEKHVQDVMNAARIAGKLPELPQMRALNDERTAILKAGIDELRNKLSPAGWQVIDKFFSGMGISGARADAPK